MRATPEPALTWPEARAGRPRVLLLLGKPVERSPVMPDVVAGLETRGAVVRTLTPRADRLPSAVTDADLVVLRGLRRPVLAAVARLETAGLRCCNSARATLATRTRAEMHQRLVRSGVPVPESRLVDDLDQAAAWAGGPLAVKVDDLDASGGAGAGVTPWKPDAGPDGRPGLPGPYLVQQWVPGDGRDRKLYVIGTTVHGLMKEPGRGRRTGVPFEPGPRLREVAQAAGQALGLRVYGVDVVEGPAGPVVVDVNAFPSCAGVPGAAEAIAQTLWAMAGAARDGVDH